MDKPFEASLIVGRMQGLHNGHTHLIDTALKLSNKVFVLLGSSQESGTVENPFSVESRKNQINAIYSSAFDDILVIDSIRDLDAKKLITEEWSYHVLNAAKQLIGSLPDVIIYGHESKNINWFKISDTLKQQTSEMTEMIIPRERHNVSGTQMRKWMYEDNYAAWAYHINSRLHNKYKEIRDTLLQVPGIDDFYKKKLKPWNDNVS